VFTNFKADEIDLARTGARGVAALKRYLQFAEDGRLDLAEASDRAPDSVFEELVAERIRSLGYEVHPQVGSGGFFIDLAVVDPDRPGRYLLGVECDGRSYHSASWARDRDRLRQEILEGLGWSLHRIWSTDWFRNPERELRRVAESLERAGARRGGGGSGNTPAGPAGEAPGGGRGPGDEPFRREQHSSGARHLVAEPYRCADVSRLRGELRLHGCELHSSSPGWLARWVTAVVEVESPVHEIEVVRRVVDGAGYQRSGSRLQATVEKAIAKALRSRAIERRGPFLWDGNERSLVPRDRGDRPASARRMDLIAPEEIEAAVLAVVSAAAGIGRDEAAVEVARLFGFARTTPSIGEPILRCIESLEEKGVLEASGNQVRLVERLPEAVRDRLA
jgi:very-short-patch-repair endonuclease